MNQADHQYANLLYDLLTDGDHRETRNGPVRSLFGHQMRFDLSEGFPLLTTKRVHFYSVVHELLWMLSGSTNVKPLQVEGVRIWDEWADLFGDLGPVYGAQWRSWVDPHGAEHDQIHNLVQGLIHEPHSRRHVVSAWNPGELDDMALPPCHCLFQFHVTRGKLSCQLYQRSADAFLGLPFNIASYALLTHMVAQVTGYEPGEFIHTLGDVHLYENHVEQAQLQLTRTPKPLPHLTLTPRKSIDDFRYEDVQLTGYDPHPTIKAEVSP